LHGQNKERGLLATCSYDNFINLWDYEESIKSVMKIEAENKVNKIAFSYTNQNIIASYSDNEVNIWDLRMTRKTALKTHKVNDSRSLHLEFDSQTGLLLYCTTKRVYIYSDENFNHPLIINSRSLIQTAKFTPFESGFAVVEAKNKQNKSPIKLCSLYLNSDKLCVKDVDFIMHKNDVVVDLCFRKDHYDGSYQIIYTTNNK